MLWVGLGNPGSSYAKNRHNVGFMALDYLAEAYRFADWRQTKPAAETSGLVGATKIRLLKPLSYMNRSGLAVAQMAKYYDIAPENILVFHDDIDLGAGKIRVKQGGGHGGHNGLRDIDRHIGKEYWRVRIGAMARALEGQCVAAMASLVGQQPRLFGVEENSGAGGVFGPPDRGFPATGVMALGQVEVPGWTYAQIDRAAIADVRADGHVLNMAHWPEQAARLPHIETIALA